MRYAKLRVDTTFFRIVVLTAVWLLLAGCQADSFLTEDFQKDSSVVTEKSSAEDTAEKESDEEDTKEDREERNTEYPKVYVYVCGYVKNPGLYDFPEGSRVQLAVERAGGFTDNADPIAVNLAEVLTDGMQLYIPKKGESLSVAGSAGKSSETVSGILSGSGTGKVNLNTATLEELQTLSGIGESRAEDILEYRETNGKFHSIEDVMKVSGIGEGIFQKIKDNVTV